MLIKIVTNCLTNFFFDSSNLSVTSSFFLCFELDERFNNTKQKCIYILNLWLDIKNIIETEGRFKRVNKMYK